MLGALCSMPSGYCPYDISWLCPKEDHCSSDRSKLCALCPRKLPARSPLGPCVDTLLPMARRSVLETLVRTSLVCVGATTYLFLPSQPSCVNETRTAALLWRASTSGNHKPTADRNAVVASLQTVTSMDYSGRPNRFALIRYIYYPIGILIYGLKPISGRFSPGVPLILPVIRSNNFRYAKIICFQKTHTAHCPRARRQSRNPVVDMAPCPEVFPRALPAPAR